MDNDLVIRLREIRDVESPDSWHMCQSAADEIERLRLSDRRLAAITRWLDANQPDVFRRGLWDAIHAASFT